jgi:hypothetical protein
LHRRHLDESQRAMVGARLANMKEGRQSSTAPIGAVSQGEAASLTNVGRMSVQRALDVLNLAYVGRIGVSTSPSHAASPSRFLAARFVFANTNAVFACVRVSTFVVAEFVAEFEAPARLRQLAHACPL